MSEVAVPPPFDDLGERHDEIYVLLAPPRTSSTAVARMFWEQPSVGYYAHEPFEVTYYDHAPLPAVAAKLDAPLDVRELKGEPANYGGSSLVIKEMPYQVGERFLLLARLATRPLVFLLRNPCQNIASRMEKKQETGDSPVFPHIETGWELVAAQIDLARDNGVPFVVVDTNELRNNPEPILWQLFERLDLPFSKEMLTWQALPDVELDNLGGRHRHLYRRVLESDGLQPALEPVPGVDFFPDEGGLRAHVERCLLIYKRLLATNERITA